MNRPVEDAVIGAISAQDTLNTIAAQSSGTEYWYILLKLLGWDWAEIAAHRQISYQAVYAAKKKMAQSRNSEPTGGE